MKSTAAVKLENDDRMSLGQPCEHFSSNMQRAAHSFHSLLTFFQAVPGTVEFMEISLTSVL